MTGKPFAETCEDESGIDDNGVCQQDENMRRAFFAEHFGNDSVNSQPFDRHELFRRTLRDELLGNNLSKREEPQAQETGIQTLPKTQNNDMISWSNKEETSSIKGGRYDGTENIPTPKLTVYTFAGAGGGKSSQGHIAVGIGDEIYSYGENGMDIQENYKYLNSNSFRDAVAQELNLNPNEINHIEEIFKNTADQPDKGKNDYNLLTHNCGDLLEGGLEDLGYDLGVNIRPKSLGESLIDAGLVSNSQKIPKTQPPEGKNFFWTATELPGTTAQSDTRNIPETNLPKNQDNSNNNEIDEQYYFNEEEEEEEEENIEFFGP